VLDIADGKNIATKSTYQFVLCENVGHRYEGTRNAGKTKVITPDVYRVRDGVQEAYICCGIYGGVLHLFVSGEVDRKQMLEGYLGTTNPNVGQHEAANLDTFLNMSFAGDDGTYPYLCLPVWRVDGIVFFFQILLLGLRAHNDIAILIKRLCLRFKNVLNWWGRGGPKRGFRWLQFVLSRLRYGGERS
jgi:hypothetical protein